MNDIRETMEHWARWRHAGFRQFGYGKPILQRVLEGMPGTGCPTCGGRGRAPGALIGHKATYIPCPTCGGSGRVKLDESDHQTHRKTCPHCERGEVNGRTCFRCRGSGVLETETDKVNPAFITSTYREPDNPTLQRVDRLVCELRQRDTLHSHYFVIWQEYCDRRGGTQAMKSRRLGLTEKKYLSLLNQALDMIEQGMRSKEPANKLEFIHD